MAPQPALAAEFKKSRAESVLKFTICQLVSLATDAKARKPRILGEIPMGYEKPERQPWISRHPYENIMSNAGQRVPVLREVTKLFSDALVSFVGPFQLHGVLANFFGFPGTDVANFTVGIVVPALTGNRIGNGFA